MLQGERIPAASAEPVHSAELFLLLLAKIIFQKKTPPLPSHSAHSVIAKCDAIWLLYLTDSHFALPTIVNFTFMTILLHYWVYYAYFFSIGLYPFFNASWQAHLPLIAA